MLGAPGVSLGVGSTPTVLVVARDLQVELTDSSLYPELRAIVDETPDEEEPDGQEGSG